MQVIDAYIDVSSMRVGNDRSLVLAWRANALVNNPPARRKLNKQPQASNTAHAKSVFASRCMDEYFAADKVKNFLDAISLDNLLL